MEMLRKRAQLSAVFVRTVQEAGKYHDGMGMGLFLWVKPNGTRFWVQRVNVRGRRREMGLGSPPVVTLAEAREQAFENKRLIRRGGDPLAQKRRDRKRKTFEEATRAAHEEYAPTWKNPKDQAAFLRSLELHIFPHFGSLPIDEVRSADVRKAILAARERAPGVAKKLTYRVSQVFRWAIAEGYREDNPATADALALPRVENVARHRKALPYDEVAACIQTVWDSRAWIGTKLAFEFLVLTACRSGEVRKARWEDIELDPAPRATRATGATCAVWSIPAEVMKMKRPHRVPLSGRAVEVLKHAQAIQDRSGLVFPSMRGKVLSDMTLSKLIKELGFEADVHGFRTSFRTWAQEQTDYPREIAEAALAHKIGDAVEQAYARSDYFEKRHAMMEDWAGYLANQNAG